MTKGGNIFAYQARSKFKLISVSPTVGYTRLAPLSYPGCAKFTLNIAFQNNSFQEVSSSYTSLLIHEYPLGCFTAHYVLCICRQW